MMILSAGFNWTSNARRRQIALLVVNPIEKILKLFRGKYFRLERDVNCFSTTSLFEEVTAQLA